MKAVVYARYSTENQSADSIEDQFRVCERLAERHGFTVTERFSDAAISGGTTERPGYQAMLAGARAKGFKVIVAEDTSRLWRSLPEQWRAVSELMDGGVHIVTQDIDTRSENFKILLSVHGAMADVYRDQIGYRTRRGLQGRARHGKPTGGRAYGYVAARDGVTAQREVHQEQAETVRRIFAWYVTGKSPRWIAGELNRLEVPSPGALWNRTSDRLHAKRKRGWVPTAIHGDRRRGKGILNNRAYAGEIVWGRSTWKRSAADSKQRRWQLSDAAQVVTHQEERLRIVPQALWDAVKARQDSIEGMTTNLRGALKRSGTSARHLLSGLLVCAHCGGAFRCVNGREYGCASYRDGGESACTNRVRVRMDLAEEKLLDRLGEEMLSPEGVALLERRIRERMKAQARLPKATPKPQAAQIAKKAVEIEQLRALIKAGTLSQAVGQAAISKAEEKLQSFERSQPAKDEKQTARVIRMLPRAAELLRQRMRGGNLGLRDPRSIVQGRNTLFGMFGGKVPLRTAQVRTGEKPYLIARIGLNRAVLLQAAGDCVEFGSGGPITHSATFLRLSLEA